MIRKYFSGYNVYNPNKWTWIPYTYARTCSLEEQSKWNELYLKTRARFSNATSGNPDITVPDFYSVERDADQFGMTEVTITDIFGLKWYGRKGKDEYVSYPDYEGHLYFLKRESDDEDYDEEPYSVSTEYTFNNPPDPKVFERFHRGHYQNNRYEWWDIANITDVNYRYVVENHLFKDSRINFVYEGNNVTSENPENIEYVYDDCMFPFIAALEKFGKKELFDKIMKQMNEHFEALKNSDREEEREYWPGKTAEEYYADWKGTFKE